MVATGHVYVCERDRCELRGARQLLEVSPSEMRTATGGVARCPQCDRVLKYRPDLNVAVEGADVPQVLPGITLTEPLKPTHDGNVSRLLGKARIAGKDFWVDACELKVADPGGNQYGVDDDGISDAAVSAFALEGHLETVEIGGRNYGVFIYPTAN